MQGFDLEQLRTLVAVVQAGSVTAGAQRVFLSQSAASEQLRKLEERAGQLLLQRSKAGVVPTPAGERLLAYAQQLLALSETAWRDLHGEVLNGELRLGLSEYFRPAQLAPLLARLATHHPQVRLHVAVGKSSEVEAAFARGAHDVALTMRITATGQAARATGASGRVLLREPLRWMAASNFRWVRGDTLRLLALPENCALHQFTVRLLRNRRIPHQIVHLASGVAGLQAAVVAGLGVACLNESSRIAGMGPLAASNGLPALPHVAFSLLPARKGESDFVVRARDLLATQLLQ